MESSAPSFVVVEDGVVNDRDEEKSFDLEAAGGGAVLSDRSDREDTPLISSSSSFSSFSCSRRHQSLVARRCTSAISRACSRGLLVTVLLTCLFVASLTLFALFPESGDGTVLRAVAASAPWTHPLSAGTAVVEVTLMVQRAVPELRPDTAVELRVRSGNACSEDSPCVLVVRIAQNVRASIADSFKLDKNAVNGSVTVYTNSTMPIAVMVKILELR